QREFILVDTVLGQRNPAFDHDVVAAALRETEKTMPDVTARTLPFRALEFEWSSADIAGDNVDQKTSDTSVPPTAVVLIGPKGRWRWILPAGPLQRLENSPSENGRLFLPAAPSVNGGVDMTLTIRNDLNIPVTLQWVNSSRERTSYGKIAAGTTRQQHTFAGHAWVLVDDSGTDVAALRAVESQPDVVLDNDALKSLKERFQQKSSPEPRKNRRSKAAAADSPNADNPWQAFVKDHNLWLRRPKDWQNRSADQPIGLTTDATAEKTFRKTFARQRLVNLQYSMQDPPPETPDVHWSPDGKFLLAWQTQMVPEPQVHYVEALPENSERPQLMQYPYARAGDPLPVPRPRLFRMNDHSEIPVDTTLFANPFELRFVNWDDSGRRFRLLYNERGHQVLRLLEVSTDDGSVRPIVDEHSDTFIHYSSDGKFILEWLPDEQLLWASERSGWNHLYRIDVRTGDVINPVTSGEWNVRRIQHIDRRQQTIWFYAVGIMPDQDPYHEHFCRVRFDGSDLKILTEGDGTHEVTMSPDRQCFIDRWSRVDLPHVTELRRSSDGHLMCVLEKADASEILSSHGSFPERFVAPGRDGRTLIWGIIHRPRIFDPEKSYPIVENIYAGPHNHHVPKSFRSSYRHQWEIADRGAVVVQIDGMGTAWRSRDFHEVCFKNLRDAGFPDRIAWIKAAAKVRPWMDISRVGIYGGSAGGQNAMAALLWHGDFYHAAVADCGCHDNRMDKLWWNEQWMGWPVEQHYAENSNTENASLLKGHLMLVVGERDRNVDPSTTLQVVQKLIAADRNFDFLLVPGKGHGACETPWASRRRADFLAGHLQMN
ncbi:MAG: prolyl oligopeptidase family serine peptidase, partial [Planctomycetaceae bacterium]|nr:prolyl oligopeptidase family serine peptidase [Planctomycetaceae bacterium]